MAGAARAEGVDVENRAVGEDGWTGQPRWLGRTEWTGSMGQADKALERSLPKARRKVSAPATAHPSKAWWAVSNTDEM